MMGPAALLLSAAAAPSQASLAGLYQTQQMEAGGALELQPGGRFRYSLEYGAVSERAQGEWSVAGGAVLLTSNPMPKLPTFELVSDEPAPKGELFMTVDPQGFEWTGRIDGIGMIASGEQGLVTTGPDGRVDSGGRTLTAIDPLVPVYGTVAGHFPLSPDRGHRLRLRFHANELGQAAFQQEPLAIDSGALLMKRYDTVIRFVRIRP